MTKWFVEVNTGVYVGNINSRVRDEVWKRITENIGRGHATMVFSAPGEQHLDFRVHNSYWQPVDFDGIKLMRRPERTLSSDDVDVQTDLSKASVRHMVSKKRVTDCDMSKYCVSTYIVLDFETTGLDEQQNEIIEIAALYVEHDVIKDKLQLLVRCSTPLPSAIVQLTGISGSEVIEKFIPLDDALNEFFDFAESLPFLCYNAQFEQAFLSAACKRIGEEPMENRFIDALQMSKSLLYELDSFKLVNVADFLNIPHTTVHRALQDCEMTYGVYCKLKEMILNK